jgi:hypothetical protein
MPGRQRRGTEAYDRYVRFTAAPMTALAFLMVPVLLVPLIHPVHGAVAVSFDVAVMPKAVRGENDPKSLHSEDFLTAERRWKELPHRQRKEVLRLSGRVVFTRTREWKKSRSVGRQRRCMQARTTFWPSRSSPFQ